MLLAVEGGRFFSSSASGYSNGLNLLLLGQKKDEKPMRVSPWTQYHLVDQEHDPNIQLAANKNRCTCGCASFTCFGGPTAENSTRPSVGPTHQNHQNVDENSRTSKLVEGDNTNGLNVNSLRSSLKKRVVTVPESVTVNNGDEIDEVYQSARRSVHWTDVRGGELCEIREFEPRYDYSI